MMKQILLMCCVIISLAHAEYKIYQVFLPISASLLGGQGLVLLGLLGKNETKTMIVENKLKVTCYITLQLGLFYGWSVALVNFVNTNNTNK